MERPLYRVRGRAKIYECQHGPARAHERRKEQPGTNNKHDQEAKSRLTYQGSMKSDCIAKLKVLRVDRFPDLATVLDLTHRSAKALRKAKEQASGRLWKALVLASSSEAAEGTEVVVEYHVVLPTVDAHNGHLSTTVGVAAAQRSQQVQLAVWSSAVTSW